MGALHEENKISPDAFEENGANLTVAKALDGDSTRLGPIFFTDMVGQYFRTGTGKYFGRLHS